MTEENISARDLIWAVGSACAQHGKPFDAELLLRQFAPPYSSATLIRAARSLGFQARLAATPLAQLENTRGPAFVLLKTPSQDAGQSAQLTIGLLVRATQDEVTWIPSGTNTPSTESLKAFEARYSGQVLLLQAQADAVADPDASGARSFGFAWFVPELLKHKAVWRDVLWASLVLQLLALGLPLFTQAIIDKVVVHRTDSTLIAVAIGMGIFMVATAVLTWVRQYLVLHTGNRVDAVLAATVFEHLFRLPPRYFAHRPTGVVAARLHGVETIREFVSSAAVTLVLDIPFLLVAVAVMFYYSITLTLIALGILALVSVFPPWWPLCSRRG